MRILGYSKMWDKLQRPVHTTFRFTRKDKDWQVGEIVQEVYQPRRKGGGDKLNVVKIVNKESRDLYRVGVTVREALEDGFEGIGDMGQWLDKTYGRRWLNEPMNKLTLKREIGMIQVSDGLGDVSGLKAFVRNVLTREGLTHWPVHIWSCRGEGICSDTICFGLCTTSQQTRTLFLHEVAHAILNPKRSCYSKDWHKDSYRHKTAWQEEFKRLAKTYHIRLSHSAKATHYLIGVESDIELEQVK